MKTDQVHEDIEQEEIEIEAIGIEVSSQPIELYKVFKIANLVNGGGEAKHIIAEGYVAVNGEIETRKRRKMLDGDLIEFNQEYYVVICVDGDSDNYSVIVDENEPSVEEFLPTDIEVADIEMSADEVIEAPQVDEDTSTDADIKDQPTGRKTIQFF